MVGYYVKEN